jgi:hypothetical protein
MKRQFHSSSPPSSPLSNSQFSDEFEPVPKRPRIFVSSPTPPPDDDSEIDEEEEEIIIDEPIIPSVTITEDRLEMILSINIKSSFLFFFSFSSESEHDSDDDDDDDNDIIEIEQQNLNSFAQQTDNGIIVLLDSDSDSDNNSDDQGIDVTDDILPSVSSIINGSISSPDIEDLEIVQEETEEELTLMDDEEEGDDHESLEIVNNDTDDDHESLEIVNNDNNTTNNNELIDLTDDEPIPISCSPIVSERKLSVDVQQCPICLETLSHLQRTGVYLIITRCRHVMCTLCSRQLLATSSRCPLCRENVSSTTLMPYCILT